MTLLAHFFRWFGFVRRGRVVKYGRREWAEQQDRLERYNAQM